MLKVEKYRGKQIISTVCMSFSKNVYFSIVFAAVSLSSNSVSAQTRGRGLLRKSGPGEGGGTENQGHRKDSRARGADRSKKAPTTLGQQIYPRNGGHPRHF